MGARLRGHDRRRRDPHRVVFNLHGVGQYAAQSIGALDVPPVLVIVMFGAFFVVLLSAIVDVVFALLDPRVRFS